jgi:hypothetical protein
MSSAILLALLATTPASDALAQAPQPSPAEIAAARTLAVEGLKLAEEGNCAEAVGKLQRAESLFHAPTVLGRLGECQVALGKIVVGTENLQRVVREQLPANASAAFLAAQDRARKVLDAALPRIALLQIDVVAPTGFKPEVKVDGESVPAALLGTQRPTDPGERKVEATAPGCDVASATVKLAEAERSSVRLVIEHCTAPVVAPPSATAAHSASPPPAPPASGPPPRSRTGAYIALGVGVAAVAVGSVFGVLALGKKSSLEDACPGKKCPDPSEQSEIDSLNGYSIASSIGFGVGVVGLGVGVAMLLWPSRQAPSPADGDRKPSASSPHLTARPWLGPGSCGLMGTF